ncbi:MAG: hypothetical protein Q4C81_05340 [Kocuria sp.]|nr:hypothetical protein [Kocuria sp.]
MSQDSLYRTVRAEPRDYRAHGTVRGGSFRGERLSSATPGDLYYSVFDDDPIRTLSVSSYLVRDATVGEQASGALSSVLTLNRQQRGNLVILRTVLALLFALCLALALSDAAAQQSQNAWIGRATELGLPAFIGQISLGGIFVLTGILTTHHYIHASPRTVWADLVAHATGTSLTTLIPGVTLVVVLADAVAPSTVFKVALTVLPAWIVGCVTIALLVRHPWAQIHMARIAPALLVVAMGFSWVVGVVLSRSAPPVGSALWGEPTFSWSQTLTCMAHLSSYFFAGSFVVGIGGALLKRPSLLRFLLPVLGAIMFVVLLPLAMAGVDIGQPFLALALLPAVIIPMPQWLRAQDLWLGIVLYGWPVHLVLLLMGASEWDTAITAVVVVSSAVLLSVLSWWFIQKPLTDKFVGSVDDAQPTEEAKAPQQAPVSARFRWLALAEGEDFA